MMARPTPFGRHIQRVPPEPGRTRRRWTTESVVLTVVVAALVCACIAVMVARCTGGRSHAALESMSSVRFGLPPTSHPYVQGNGFDTYIEAISVCTLAEGKPGAEEDEALINDFRTGRVSVEQVRPLLQANARALELVHEAADKEYCAPFDPGQALERKYPSVRCLARLVATKVRAQHLAGDDAGALRTSLDGWALSVNAPQHGCLIDMLVGASVAAVTEDQTALVLTEGDPSFYECLNHARQMRRLRERLPPFAEVLAYEYEIELCVADSYLPEIAWKRSLEWIGTRYAEFAQEAEALRGTGHMRELGERLRKELAATDNPIRRALTIEPDKSYEKYLGHEVLLLGEETMAMLAAFRAERGAYPDSLEQVVPSYMPEVPIDPWTGAPFCYRREGAGYRLYCVGPDLEDNGGSWVETPDHKPDYYEDVVLVPSRYSVR